MLIGITALAAAFAIPLGHLIFERGTIVQGVRVAGVPLAGTSRAEAARRISTAVNDQLQRDVIVTVGRRRATLSPYDLGVRVDAARTARAALTAGRVRGGLLFSLGYSHAIEPFLRYPSNLALPARLADTARAPVNARLVLKASGAAIAIPAKPGVGFNSNEALAAIARAARRPTSRDSYRHRSASPARARMPGSGPLKGSRRF